MPRGLGQIPVRRRDGGLPGSPARSMAAAAARIPAGSAACICSAVGSASASVW
jgi:hypothetical protein